MNTERQEVLDLFQKDIRIKLEDLKNSVKARNNVFSAWERDFINDITLKLQNEKITVSVKQFDIIERLWDKA